MILGSAVTDATGHYEIQARAERPGYVAGCDFLILFVEEFQYFTTPSGPIRCITAPQNIDLATVTLSLLVHR